MKNVSFLFNFILLLASQNVAGYIRDQCCHLQGDRARFDYKLPLASCLFLSGERPEQFLEAHLHRGLPQGADNCQRVCLVSCWVAFALCCVFRSIVNYRYCWFPLGFLKYFVLEQSLNYNQISYLALWTNRLLSVSFVGSQLIEANFDTLICYFWWSPSSSTFPSLDSMGQFFDFKSLGLYLSNPNLNYVA